MDIYIRPYEEGDFSKINALSQAESWTNLVEKQQDAKQAWANSTVAFVAEVNGEFVGCIRGLTDGFISLYICELIVDQHCRGQGVGKKLLNYVHELFPKARMELLASQTSKTFYESNSFRPFYGFRKIIEE
ncbi:GNAT family N-acetyltransferase [Planococcus sp. YIM B11945]|uniref:GNAT family N-acetyltransferase n=1 Tax=Planococcus sp. YIM B11945 TaxID=3435410 RepID=UPI003D7DDEC9